MGVGIILIMLLLINQAFLCGDGSEDNERIVFNLICLKHYINRNKQT